MILLIFTTVLLHLVRAAHNITVDDTSSLISYTGTWKHSSDQSDRFNSTTHYTKVQGSYATFSFTGATWVYYIGYGLLADQVPDTMMDVVFDGTTFTVNASKPSAERSQAIIWSTGPLDPTTTHTIVCRKSSVNDTNGMDVNVDAFKLTIPDDGDVLPTESIQKPSLATTFTSALPWVSGLPIPSQIATAWSSTGTDCTTQPSWLVWSPLDAISSAWSNPIASVSPPVPSNSEQKTVNHNTTPIVGGVLGGVALIAIVAAFFFLLGRRRRQADERDYKKHHDAASARESPMSAGFESSIVPRSLAQVPPAKTRDARPLSTVWSDMSSPVDTPVSMWPTGPPAYTPRFPLQFPSPLGQRRFSTEEAKVDLFEGMNRGGDVKTPW